MTLAKIIDTLKMLALKHPNINSAYEGNIYDILNANPDNKYASVVLTQQSHTTDATYDHYGFVIFYVDRLMDDLEENRVQIQSIGKSMLNNIITAFCNNFEAECDNISFQTFTQRFADETAGVYCTITIDMVKDIFCEEKLWEENWVAPVVSIRNQNKSVVFTENGSYTIDYDPENYTGLGTVQVEVNIPLDEIRDNAYSDGYNNGREEGYNSGRNDGYGEGKTDGVNEQKSKLETINITENGTYSKEDGYNNVEVNVIPKVNVAKEQITFAYSKFTEVPDWAYFDGITDLSNMFSECGNLKRIPAIDTSQVTDMNNTFKSCSNLETIPLLDTSKVTTMDSTFWYCTTLTNFPPIDTSSVTLMANTFSNCYALTSLPALNMQSLSMYSFYGIFGYNELPNLTHFGGFLNLKQSLTDDKNLKKLPNLTYESCINVLNGLYDFVAAGETPNSEQGQLKVHQNFLDKVGDKVSIATEKGWLIQA